LINKKRWELKNSPERNAIKITIKPSYKKICFREVDYMSSIKFFGEAIVEKLKIEIED
jgi:hypothetical protein